MPFYDYKCSKCGKRFEVQKSMNDTSEVSCPICKAGKAQRIFTPFRIMGAENMGSGCPSCSSGVCPTCNLQNQ